MMKEMTICLWLLSCTALGMAQDGNTKSISQSKPDLSGTWEIDKKKTDLWRFGRDLRKSGIILIVQHQEPEIRIIRKYRSEGKDHTQVLVYYTDGRGEKNPQLVSKGVAESKTLWDSNKLVSKTLNRLRTPRGILEIEALNKWELSADGRTLTQTITYGNARVTPGGQSSVLLPPPAEKRIFNRVP